jgi:hypothetical protein
VKNLGEVSHVRPELGVLQRSVGRPVHLQDWTR